MYFDMRKRLNKRGQKRVFRLLDLFLMCLKVRKKDSSIFKKANLLFHSFISRKTLCTFHHRVKWLKIISFCDLFELEIETVLGWIWAISTIQGGIKTTVTLDSEVAWRWICSTNWFSSIDTVSNRPKHRPSV